MIMTSSESELALMAAICQGHCDYTAVELEWLTNQSYRMVLTAFKELKAVNFEYDICGDVVLAYFEQTNRRADRSLVAELFHDPVTGTSIAYHQSVLKRNWLTAKADDLCADIELAARNGAVDKLKELTATLESIKTEIESGSSRDRMRANTVGDILNPRPEAEPVIEGLQRRGEVGTIVSGPKIAKSWLVTQLAMSIISENDWLGRRVLPGKVLLVDNELRDITICDRTARVARAMGVSQADINDRFSFIPLRGRSLKLIDVYEQIKAHITDEHVLVIMDSKYRFFTDLEENSNSDQTAFHNEIDRWAMEFNIGIMLVHHASKGSQGGKSVADVGAGGGAQSRAADCHIVIREHDEAEHFVIEAALRTFPKIEPQTAKMNFPLWEIVEDVAPSVKLAPTRNEVTVERSQKTKITTILDMLRRSPSGIETENKLSGNNPSRTAFRAALNELEGTGEIEFVPDYIPPRRKNIAPAWKLTEGTRVPTSAHTPHL